MMAQRWPIAFFLPRHDLRLDGGDAPTERIHLVSENREYLPCGRETTWNGTLAIPPVQRRQHRPRLRQRLLILAYRIAVRDDAAAGLGDNAVARQGQRPDRDR
jgi:hypothetical protein